MCLVVSECEPILKDAIWSTTRQENGQIYEHIIHNSEQRANTTYTFYNLIYFKLPSSAYNAIIRLAVHYAKHQHTLPTHLL